MQLHPWAPGNTGLAPAQTVLKDPKFWARTTAYSATAGLLVLAFIWGFVKMRKSTYLDRREPDLTTGDKWWIWSVVTLFVFVVYGFINFGMTRSLRA